MLNRSAVLGACIAVSVVALAPIAGATVILNRDFQADTVGENPAPNSGSTLSEFGAVDVIVVDATGSPADPFGGAGNKSLSYSAANTGVQGQYVMAAPLADALEQGTASLDFYQSSSSNPLAELVVGNFDGFPSSSQTGPWLAVNGATNILVFTAASTLTLDQSVSADQAHNIAIIFDAATDTFTATLDGVALTADGGVTTSFPFFSPLTGVNAWSVSAPSGSRTGDVFIDNVRIEVVPEPGMLSLLGMVSLAAIRRRR